MLPPYGARLIALYVVFTVGILMWMPAASISVRQMLQMVGVAI